MVSQSASSQPGSLEGDGSLPRDVRAGNGGRWFGHVSDQVSDLVRAIGVGVSPCSPFPRRAAAAPRTFAILWRRRYPWSKESQGHLVPVVVGLPLRMPDLGVIGGSTTAPLTGRGH